MMTQHSEKSAPPSRLSRWRIRLGLLLLVLIPGVALLMFTFLATTPAGSRLVSRHLSRIAGQPVTIDRITLSRTAITLEGIAVRNLPPFTGNLLIAGSVTIAPDPGLLRGIKAFSLVRASRVILSLEKGAPGTWNITPLVRKFGSMPGGGETFIRELRVEGASVRLNGRSLPGLDLSLRDLATRGSREATWQARLSVGKASTVPVNGTARPGPSPGFTLTTDLAGIPLDELATSLHLPPALHVADGRVTLHLSARMSGGVVTAEGSFRADHVNAVLTNGVIPLSGTVGFAAEYRQDQDTVRLTRCRVSLDDLVAFTGTATVRDLRGTASYSSMMEGEASDLARVQALLHPASTKDLAVKGRLGLTRLSLEGNARDGLTSCEGSITLWNGEASWKGRHLLMDTGGDIVFRRGTDGWCLAGKVASGGESAAAEIRRIKGVFSARLSPSLKLVTLDAVPLSVRLRGIDLDAGLRYDISRQEPLSFRVRTDRAPLPGVERALGGAVVIDAGIASVLVVGGRSRTGMFRGAIDARVEGVRGTLPGKPFTVEAAILAAAFRGSSGQTVTADGSLSGTGSFTTLPAVAAGTFSLTPRSAVIRNGSGRLGSASLSFDLFEAWRAEPRRQADSGIPFTARGTNLAISWNDLTVGGVTGAIDGVWRTCSGSEHFEGVGGLTLGHLAWRGWSANGVTARLVADGNGIGGDVTGTGLGGVVIATLQLDPYRAGRPAAVHLEGRGLSAGQVFSAFGKSLPVSVTGGPVTIVVDGKSAPGAPPSFTFAGKGSGLAVIRRSRTLISGAGVGVSGEYAAGDLTLKEGRVTVGDAVAVAVNGSITGLPGVTREGLFSFTLPPTPLAALVDAAANLLPLPFQGMEGHGTVETNGDLKVMGTKTALQAEVSVTDGSIAVPSRSIFVEGIDGTLPLSVTLPPEGVSVPQRHGGFSRQAFPAELDQFRNPPGAPSLRIARFRLGPLEAVDTKLHLNADGVSTDLIRLETSLYGGTILGRGSCVWGAGPVYDADLLVHDLSLGKVCASLPKIAGYISGKVDGIVGIHGEQGGLDGMIGFFDFWARSADDEPMLVSREFLQKLAGKNLKGFFFRDDRPFDRGEISGSVSKGYVTFSGLDISHTTLFGIRDLSVSVAPLQNRISLDHLITSIRAAARRGKPSPEEGEPPAQDAAPATEFKWLE